MNSIFFVAIIFAVLLASTVHARAAHPKKAAKAVTNNVGGTITCDGIFLIDPFHILEAYFF